MNDETVRDLKQFISAELHQQTSDIRGDISDIRGDISDIRGDVKKLDEKVDDIAVGVADALETSSTESQKQIDNHGHRITKLEQKAA